MKVNVVTKHGWILGRLADELNFATVNCGEAERKADPEADLNYYMPARDVMKYPCPGRAAGLYTHGPTAFGIAERFEVCVTMNRSMARDLTAMTKARRIETIRPGTEVPLRRPVFGVLGRVYGKARKGANLVEEAVRAGFDFRACSEPQRAKKPPCQISHPIEERSAFLDSIDYLVVTSTLEGGPMPVIEALAHHVPVIAPDVGWCWEFPVIRYKRGSWKSLSEVLAALSNPPTWATWTSRHRALFEEILT